MPKSIEREAGPRPIDDLVGILRRQPEDPASIARKARKAAMEKCLELQGHGEFPADSEMHLWNNEHDKKVQGVIRAIRVEFRLTPHVKTDNGKGES